MFTKEELLRDVWGYRSAGRTRTLDSHASRLRRKLDPERGDVRHQLLGRRLPAGGELGMAVARLHPPARRARAGRGWRLRPRRPPRPQAQPGHARAAPAAAGDRPEPRGRASRPRRGRGLPATGASRPSRARRDGERRPHRRHRSGGGPGSGDRGGARPALAVRRRRGRAVRPATATSRPTPIGSVRRSTTSSRTRSVTAAGSSGSERRVRRRQGAVRGPRRRAREPAGRSRRIGDPRHGHGLRGRRRSRDGPRRLRAPGPPGAGRRNARRDLAAGRRRGAPG